MDLRRRLVAYLSGFALALLVVTSLVVWQSLRDDVAEEMAASVRLTELLLTVSRVHAGGTEELAGLLSRGGLRHVAVSLERPETQQSVPFAPPTVLDRVAAWLPIGARDAPTHRIAVGDHVLVIRADPDSEIREILRDAARMITTLLAFSLATVAVAWHAAHRALSPVRALEEALARLACGETRPQLPSFELREFRRIAGAIEHLAASLAASRAAEKQLARRLMDLQESERRALARELHDEFGQSLTAIGVAAAFVERHAASDAVRECGRDIRMQASRVSRHVRGLLSQLRPHGLEGLGMVDALHELIAGWRQHAPGIAVDASLPEQLPALGPAAGLALYRTLQEALTNVLRHGRARRVKVTLEASAQAARLTVSDDGCGHAQDVRPGGGLLGMRERAAMAGGRLTLADAPGGGLQLSLWLPIEDTTKEGRDDPDPVAR